MRQCILGMSVSLDGFVSGPNGEVDWIFRSGDDDTDAYIVDTLSQGGLHAMGRRSWNDMKDYWPTSDTPFAAPMNAVPKIVFTKKGIAGPAALSGDGEPGSWANPIIADGDLATEVAMLKAQPGKDVLVHGGATFAQNLAATGLIDEYRLLVCPVALGQGLPLFSGLSQPAGLQLISSRAFGSGAIALVYRPA